MIVVGYPHNTRLERFTNAFQAAVDVLHCVSGTHGRAVVAPDPLSVRNSGEIHIESRQSSNALVLIDPNCPWVGISLAHEIGHFIEKSLLHDAESHALRTDEVFARWWNAVIRSRAYKYQYRIAVNGEIFERSSPENAGWYPATLEQRKYANYLLRPDELWARSYAQYFAHCHRSMAFFSQMVALQNSDAGQTFQVQWEPEDFAPICREINAIFEAKNWLHAVRCQCGSSPMKLPEIKSS